MWAYGAAFDRDTERYIPEAGLELVEVRCLYRDIIKLIVARPTRIEGKGRADAAPSPNKFVGNREIQEPPSPGLSR
jgi:hypothetical protein